jgi:acetyltransferase-like isoleucine patch superfamily enzyme
MDRKAALQNIESGNLYEQLLSFRSQLDEAFKEQFDRSLPFNEAVFDRWERARQLGFGEGSSIYDNSYVFGKPRVGAHTWIGPFTIIDGSGGLVIGDHCTIAVGVHIYTHDNVGQTLTGGKMPIQREPVAIGNCTYIGPNTIITKGCTIGAHCIIGANSFVNRSIPDYSVAIGAPARITGKVVVEGESYSIIKNTAESE